jgi:hypothetical protein
MSILTHGHRRGRHRTRRTGRMDIDDVLRSTDVTVHIIVLALLIAFASLLATFPTAPKKRPSFVGVL